MFLGCICSKEQKRTPILDKKSKFYDQITDRLNDWEIQMLELMYDDLASRHNSKLLNMENFLLFFNHTGLWGAKLFREFDKDGKQLITKEEFLYGMSLTARAPLNEKIQLLYNFFDGNTHNGITYRHFIKMLYNFSKEELKSILIEDGVFIEEFIINSKTVNQLSEHHCSSRASKQGLEKSVVLLDYKCPPTAITNMSEFENAYQQMINGYKDPGTVIEVKTSDRTYHIQYCNMITLVRQFASHVYKHYEVNEKTGKLSFPQFKEWIQMHDRMFSHYFSAFHLDLWGYRKNIPNYLEEGKIEKSFEGKFQNKGLLKDAFFLLIADALVICRSKKLVREPIKVICLVGLNVNRKNDENGFGMEISHTSDHYQNSTFYFPSKEEQQEWLERLKIYEGDVLQKKYTVMQMIGTGKFSIVYRCQEKATKKFYALKVIETSRLPQEAKSAISNESHIMKVVKHPQVIHYKETFTTRTNINLILEYVEGEDLFEYVRKRGWIQQHDTAFVIGQIIKAVRHLHSIDIIHRDLKPENIMVTFKKDFEEVSPKEGSEKEDIGPAMPNSCRRALGQASESNKDIENVKIIDFGLANHISELEKLSQQKLMSGTPNYIAPETLLGQKPSFKIDTFAIGSIMYFMLRGRLTFAAHTNDEVLIKTVRGDYSLDDSKWDSISDEAKDLVSQLLATDPDERIQLDEALNHSWFRKVSKQGIHLDTEKLMIMKDECKGDLKQNRLGSLFRKRRASIDLRVQRMNENAKKLGQ